MHFKFFLVRIVRRQPFIPLLNNYLKEMLHSGAKGAPQYSKSYIIGKEHSSFFQIQYMQKSFKSKQMHNSH